MDVGGGGGCGKISFLSCVCVVMMDLVYFLHAGSVNVDIICRVIYLIYRPIKYSTIALKRLLNLQVSLAVTLGQRLSDGNFLADADADYQDFQISPQAPPQAPQRAARPRSPAIDTASQAKVAPVAILKQINR